MPALVSLMQAFYLEAGFLLPAGAAADAFEALLADPRLGGVRLAEDGAEAVGHVVLTLCLSMEYGGLRAFIDDLYVRPTARGRGAGAGLLAAARTGAVEWAARALHVEVGLDDATARRQYARAGYADSGHHFLSLPLAAPLHAG